jgi:hypothetical protein
MTATGRDGNEAGEPLVGRGSALRADPGAGDGAAVGGNDESGDTAGGRDPVTPPRSVPRPPQRASRDRSWSRFEARAPSLRLALGLAVVAVLAAAWIAVGPAASRARPSGPVPASRRSPHTAPALAPQTDRPVEPVVAIPRWVPTALAATCRAHGSGASSIVVDCTPGRGVAGLRYRTFASVAALRAAYAVQGPRHGGVGPSACAEGRPEERAWSEAAAPARTVGRYRCSLVDGEARLEWTSERAGVLGIATRADADLRSLYQWWTSAPGPTTSRPTGG